MSATPAQASAYLHLFKERRGLRPWDETNQDMRSMLTYAAQREGVVAVETLVERYPDGFSELDSLVHGAALRDPGGVVEWYNRIPDDSPMRHSALTGMMFGIGQSGSDAGPRLFADLGTEDQNACVRGFAEAYARGRGIQGAQELMAVMPISPAFFPSCVRNPA